MNLQNPAQLEQQQLAAFEEQSQRSKGQLQNIFPTNRIATLEEIQRAADYTQQLADWFRTNYGQTSASLQAAGFPELANRLNAIVADLQKSHNVYMSMYQKNMQPPPTPASPSINQGTIDATNHKNDLIMGSILSQCSNCKLQFGAQEFSQLVYCPRCKAMLHE